MPDSEHLIFFFYARILWDTAFYTSKNMCCCYTAVLKEAFTLTMSRPIWAKVSSTLRFNRSFHKVRAPITSSRSKVEVTLTISDLISEAQPSGQVCIVGGRVHHCKVPQEVLNGNVIHKTHQNNPNLLNVQP